VELDRKGHRRCAWDGHARRFPMAARTRSEAERLQDLLARLNPGDEIHVAEASQETGFDTATCEMVFEALARVDIFTRTTDHVFVRRRMFDALERVHG
jgi:hypothetical protein